MTIVITRDVRASCEHLWRCIVDPDALRAWFGPHMTLDARAGGGFREVWRDGGREVVTAGRVTAFEPGARLALTWADADWPAETEVELRLIPRGDGGRIVLTHSGWERLGAAGDGLAAAHRDGWSAHLASLAARAEATGGAP